MVMAERLRTFDLRERHYPLPALGSPEEACKAALKSWRNPDRFGLSTAGADSASGRVLPMRTVFALDVARLAGQLSEPQRTIVVLYFMTERPSLRGEHDAADCNARCQAHYGNPEIAVELGLSTRSVAAYKRWAISRIAVTIFPAWYRGKKARAGV